MKTKPRDPKESLFDKSLLEQTIVSGSAIGLLLFGLWYYLINIVHMDVATSRGYVMTLMVFIQNIHVFNCRSEKKSAFTIPLKSNKLVVWGVIGSIILQIAVMEIGILSKLLQTASIPVMHLIGLFALALVILVVVELYKKIRFSRK